MASGVCSGTEGNQSLAWEPRHYLALHFIAATDAPRQRHLWGRTVSDVLLAKSVHRVAGGRRSTVDSDSASDALDSCFPPSSAWAAFGTLLVVLLQPSEPRAFDLRHGAGGSGAARGRGRMGR